MLEWAGPSGPAFCLQSLVSRIDANGRSLFYLADGLGSTMALLDPRGELVQSYEYSAFGECLSGKDAVNAFRFVGGFGGQTDDATGLVYFWNRWYDPQVGRFISEDLIRQDGGTNLYSYAENRPTLLIDETGLCASLAVKMDLSPEGKSSGIDFVVPSLWGYLGKHAWIELTENGVTKSYGAYIGSGILVDSDLGRTTTVSRTISQMEDWRASMAKQAIQANIGLGFASWTFGKNCASFAYDIWSFGSGESFNARIGYAGPITPNSLAKEIRKLNGGADHGEVGK